MWRLFAEDFMPHGTCYLWNPGVLWLNVISDSLIAASYYAIPFLLFSFARRRRDITFKWIFIAFGMFILACGTTHLMGVWTVWHPAYWLDGAIKAVTAGSSILTAALLVPLIPTLVRLPSPSQLARVNEALESEIAERKAAEEEVRQMNTALEKRVSERTAELQSSNEQLRESFERYRFLADAMPQIVWTARPDGTVDHLNHRWYEYSGADPESLEWASHVHPDDLAAVRSQWDEALKTAHMLEIEMRLRSVAGRYRWHLVRALPMRDAANHVIQWVGTSTDIDDQKQTEQALRSAHHELETLINTSPLGIYSMNASARVTAWNRSAETMFGFPREEVLGSFPPFVAPEDRPDFMDMVTALLEGQAVSNRERRRRKKDGSPIDIAIWAAPLRSDNGEIRGAICMLADNTERKQLQEQLLQSQKMDAIGRLAGGVAHDFNNLLTVISGFNDMVIQDLRDPRIIEYAREVQNAAVRASELTGQLLAFSRRQLTQPRRLNLNAVVQKTDKMLRRIIGEDIQLTTHRAPDLGDVEADPAQIDQVLLNLAVNARDAMPNGGMLTIETANAELGSEYAGRHIGVEPGPYVMLAVSDTGTGMDEETRRRLFEPFFTTKEQGKGTGLGLSIVYGVVKQNRGEILIYSEPGKGSTFKIYLPRVLTPAERVEAADPSQAPAIATGTETILVVEDALSVLRLVRDVLAKQGYRILEANSPEEARRIFDQSSADIDLLLTDIVMPQTNGVDLAREFCARRPRLKVLFMSGYTSTGVVQSGVLEADTAFIQKPFTAAALSGKVREVLESPGADG